MSSINRSAVIIVFVTLFFSVSIVAQTKFDAYEIGINGGTLIYQGDVTPKSQTEAYLVFSCLKSYSIKASLSWIQCKFQFKVLISRCIKIQEATSIAILSFSSSLYFGAVAEY